MSILISKNDFFEERQSFYITKVALEMLKNNITMENMLLDVFLLDLNMPGMDGWQFLDEFAKLEFGRTIYIFIMTFLLIPLILKKQRNTNSYNNMEKSGTVKKLKSFCKLINNKN